MVHDANGLFGANCPNIDLVVSLTLSDLGCQFLFTQTEGLDHPAPGMQVSFRAAMSNTGRNYAADVRRLQ